ncbi:YhcN/YlaJ family sporulation lipoprotein [Evansella sp. AB-rgal1]|uniref:YhcN/YlaJ family sporulation lipoprotein n=1 Tax=Evansella sp. AB-rgal1 TaxID=3242696 RepID=UPI00359D234E
MMKKSSFFMFFGLFLLTLSACGTNNDASQQGFQLFGEYQQPEERFVINRRASDEDINKYHRFGFHRDSKETAYSGQNVPQYSVYDHSLLAETISHVSATLPSIEEIAVLVTEQHVLMAYESTNNNKSEVATQLRKTAYSFVPAYFDVYVAEGRLFMKDIERFQGLSSQDPSYRGTLDATIEEMKSYPQGEALQMDDPMLKDTRFDQNRDYDRQGHGNYNRNSNRSMD